MIAGRLICPPPRARQVALVYTMLRAAGASRRTGDLYGNRNVFAVGGEVQSRVLTGFLAVLSDEMHARAAGGKDRHEGAGGR